MNAGKFTVPKLEGAGNWVTWKRQVKTALDYYDVFEIVTQTRHSPVAPPDGATEVVRTAFERDTRAFKKDSCLALNIIGSSLSEGVSKLVETYQSASEIWNCLHSFYEQKGEERQFRALKRFFSHKKDPGETIAENVSKLQRWWADVNEEMFKNDGMRFPDSVFRFKLLDSLPDQYFEFLNAWESTPREFQTSKHLIERLRNLELRFLERDDVHHSSSDPVAFVGKKKVGWDNRKSNCASAGVKSKESTYGKPGKTVVCFSCKEKGHFQRNCPKKRNKVTVDLAERPPKNYACGESAFVVSSSQRDGWIADSGATQHMTGQRDWFLTYEEFATPQQVQCAGDGQAIMALGKGTIQVVAKVGNDLHLYDLESVWYVPEISKNLFSLIVAVNKGYTCVMNNQLKIYGRDNKKLFIVGHQENGLMWLHICAKQPIQAAAGNLAATDTLQVWHERLGHQNKRHVQKFLRARGINVTVDREFCEACMYGKQSRLSFGTRVERATRPGELVHADVFGPTPAASLGGSRYFVDFKDDFTKYRSIYFMKEKSEVKMKLSDFLARVQVLGHTVKELLTDGGKEFVNKSVGEIVSVSGLHHRVTMPYTPQQNGCVERENRTLVEAARTMLHARNLPETLWAEAVNTAAYVLNRTAPTSIPGKSPIELWTGKPAPVDHLRVFGTECFVHVPGVKRRKFDRKSIKGVLVGYCDNKDGFRVYDPKNHKILVSRDVNFKQEQIVLEPVQIPVFTTEADGNPGIEYDQETDDEVFENNQNSQGRHMQLRDRSKLSKPARFDDFAMLMTLTPTSVDEALSSEHWKEAMLDEMASLHENRTWDLVKLPPDRKPISNRWVFCVKEDVDKETIRYKARLVVRGFTQRPGIDYGETFAPVARFETIRTVLGVSASEGLELAQIDIKTAFLNGVLDDEIYMEQPVGFEDGTDSVCRLNRSLYGLKQSPRCWNKRFSDFLRRCGLVQSSSDPCLFFRNGVKKLLVAIYVDDGIVAGSSKKEVAGFLEQLKREFQITVNSLTNFLGMQVCKLEDGSIFIHQAAYAKRILKCFGMDGSNPVSTPMERSSQTGEEKESVFEDEKLFRSSVGSLMYLAVATRPDLAYAVSTVSQALSRPMLNDWKAVKRIFRYVRGTVDLGLLFKSEPSTLVSFSDSDFAGDSKTRKSTSGVVSMLNGCAVDWLSQKQKCVSLSTTEAEYVAGGEAAKSTIWLHRLLKEITGKDDRPILRIDNASAVKLIKNPEFHKRTKHIDVRYHFIRDNFEKGEFDVQHIPGEEQVADIFTKPLDRIRFTKLRGQLGLMELGEKGKKFFWGSVEEKNFCIPLTLDGVWDCDRFCSPPYPRSL